MAERTRKSPSATPQGLELVHARLKKFSSNKAFADLAGVSRATVQNFLAGKPLRVDSFRAICKTLELDWEEIAGLTANSILVDNSQAQENNADAIAALVQEARQQIQPYIQERCGMMRVLDMEQPIGLGDIYTSVNILERITGRRGLDISELMQNADPEEFDRFCLGKVREKRVPGLEAVEKFSKLMILGKPGAGKTTFLKHLAMQCIGGKFQSDRVPIFITLKDFAEADDKPNLFTYIERLIAMPNVGAKHLENIFLSNAGSDRTNASPLHNILRAGKVLILLDGLDEIRESDSSHVLQKIQKFSEDFFKNHFVITCRIAAREYTFVQFTEVEVADFDNEQIFDFVNKWFTTKADSPKIEKFLQHLQEDVPIRELAASPLLLTLLCLVFEDSGNFPPNRAELYENGIDILLKKWDVKRNIQRSQVYKQLSLKRKEDLLSQIAINTFESGNYFFKEREVKHYISQYIQNLPNANNEPESLELDTVAVLKAIESQHGLLLERARGIYSFSHLTFHEYFATCKIIKNCSPYDFNDPTLRSLVGHVTDKRWHEIFILAASMLDNADTFFLLLKSQVDVIIAEEESIQKFLAQIDSKSALVQSSYKPAAIRAFYCDIDIDKPTDYDFDIDLSLDITLASGLYNKNLDLELNQDLLLTQSYCELGEILYEIDFRSEYAIRQTIAKFHKRFNLIFETGIDLSLIIALKELKMQIPNLDDELEVLEEWLKWKANYRWMQNFRFLLVKYRNIAHNWHFSADQQKLLQKYYYSTKLLVDCLNTECYVSQEVRQEIEDTLLLPIAEIEKRKQQ